MKFIKACGLGNDFVLVILENFPQEDTLTKWSLKLANRRYGVGCDQVIFAKPFSNYYQVRFFNADGSEAEACGNGSRCVSKFLMEENKTKSVNLQTLGGSLSCALKHDGQVTVHMPEPTWNLNFEDNGVGRLSTPEAVAVWVGNPHLVCFVNEIELVKDYGYGLEEHPSFPQRANVGFVKVIDQKHIQLQVWERGAGVTPACGSGACAAVIASTLRGLVSSSGQICVSQEGGDLLIEWNHPKLLMTGPAEIIFTGEIGMH